MDIKFFDNDNELVSPNFKLLLDKNKNIILFLLNNLNKTEQNEILKNLLNLSVNNLNLTDNSILLRIHKSYFFDISAYHSLNIPKNLKNGNLDLMFAFSDENNIIIDNNYPVFKLNGIKIN